MARPYCGELPSKLADLGRTEGITGRQRPRRSNGEVPGSWCLAVIMNMRIIRTYPAPRITWTRIPTHPLSTEVISHTTLPAQYRNRMSPRAPAHAHHTQWTDQYGSAPPGARSPAPQRTSSSPLRSHASWMEPAAVEGVDRTHLPRPLHSAPHTPCPTPGAGAAHAATIAAPPAQPWCEAPHHHGGN